MEQLIDGISTRYEVVGSGPPLLMFSPGGWNATVEAWSTLGVYAKIKLMDELAKKFTCIMFDRRETGRSGGRLERVTWRHYAAHGKALLEHLKIDRAHVMGGCMGCPPVLAFGTAYPAATASMVLYWPVGGAKYRISSHLRFAEHLAFVKQHGLEAVVELATREGKHFGADARGGPWVAVLKHDRAFADAFVRQDVERYSVLVESISRTMFDRDTAPGAEPEDLLQLDIPALIVPGRDASHATSAARYAEECLPRSEYWDVPPDGQTAANAPGRVIAFLESAHAFA